MSEEVTPVAEAAPAPAVEEAPRTFSQEELDRHIKDRLDRQSKKFADYDDLRAKAAELDRIKAEEMTATEKLAKERDDALKTIADIEARAKAAELANLRMKVGTEKGLPSALIDRLAGEDIESITADAEALLAAIPKSAPSVPAAVHDVMADPDADKSPQERAFLAGLRGSK